MKEKQKILIVDDKTENLFALERILSRTDAEVIRAQSGNDALIATLNHDFAAAIVDVQMPDMDGYELAELFRSQEATRNLPIIFLTAVFHDESHVYKGYEAGAVDFITKPFDPRVLLSKVNIFLELDRKRAEARRMGDELRRANEQLEEKVRQRTRALEAQARQLRNLAQQLSQTEERERRRLAELLHDDLQQLIASAKFLLSSLTDMVDASPAGREGFEQVQAVLAEAMVKSRLLSHELSPPVLQHNGLVPALEWLGRDIKAKHGLTVSVNADMQAEVDSFALSSMLYRSVKELVFNAVKHSGAEAIDVDVRADRMSILIKVRDRGRGFDPVRLRSGHSAGAGFGLLSIEERVRSLGGRLDIESAPGRGCCVSMEVLQDCADMGTEAREGGAGASEPAACFIEPAAGGGGQPDDRGRTIRLLLADDHAVMRDGLATVFRNETGFDVIAQAADGLETINLAEKLHPDVILMDVSMPELDGIQATLQISRASPNTRIIGLSMHDDPLTRARMIAAGAADYVCKSAAASEIVEAVRSACSQGNRAVGPGL